MVEGARPQAGRGPTPEQEEAEQRARRRRRWLIGGPVALVVLLLCMSALVLIFGRAQGGQGEQRPTPGPSPSARPAATTGEQLALRFLPPQDRPARNGATFRTLIGDIDGDGRDDLIWNETAETNRLYVGLAQTDGTFRFLPPQERSEKRWSGFRTLLGDVDGDGRTDLIWNETAETNRVYVGLGNADGTFRFLPAQDHPDKRWTGFDTKVGDVNGDGRSDIVWNFRQATNRLYVALSNGDGTFRFLPPQDHPAKGWSGFEVLVGDVNGDGRADLIWNARQETNRIYVGLGNADGTFQFLPPQERAERGWGGFAVFLADADGDGRADLIWNETRETNRTYLGLGTAEGVYRFLPAQDHPQKGWSDYRTLVGDVNGDGRADLIWDAIGEPNHIVVALMAP